MFPAGFLLPLYPGRILRWHTNGGIQSSLQDHSSIVGRTFRRLNKQFDNKNHRYVFRPFANSLDINDERTRTTFQRASFIFIFLFLVFFLFSFLDVPLSRTQPQLPTPFPLHAHAHTHTPLYGRASETDGHEHFRNSRNLFVRLFVYEKKHERGRTFVRGRCCIV